MSAPLVVNTTDGTVWTRRAVTRGGLALYAPDGVCNCPEFVMATLPELAERGIAGSADALPMPVAMQPDTRAVEVTALRKELDAALAQRNAVFDTNEQLQARVEEAGMARIRAENEARTLTRANSELRTRVAEQLEAYPGELAMLRGLVGVMRTIAAHSDIDELRHVLAEHEIDERAAYDTRERPADEDPIAYALTPKATAVRDVTPQVRKLRAILAGQRQQAGGAPC